MTGIMMHHWSHYRALGPTFYMTISAATISEGSPVTFTVNTTGVADGTVVYWTNIGNAGTAVFADSVNSGSVTINSNSATITRTTVSGQISGSSASIQLQITDVPVGQTPINTLATSATVTVNSTAYTSPPGPFFGIAGSVRFTGSQWYTVDMLDDFTDIGTGDFTVEAWVAYNDQSPTVPTGNRAVLSAAPALNNSTTTGIYMALGSIGGYGNQYIYRIAGNITTSVSAFTANNGFGNSNLPWTWNHIVIQRINTSGGTQPGNSVVYINGYTTNSATNSVAINLANVRYLSIGRNTYSASGSEYLVGYISSVRVTKGAVYSGGVTANFNSGYVAQNAPNFTPPVQFPLSQSANGNIAAIADGSVKLLLLPASVDFGDNSAGPNATPGVTTRSGVVTKAIVRNNTTTYTSDFSPSNGGSINFGTYGGPRYQAAGVKFTGNLTDFNFGTGAFTIEWYQCLWANSVGPVFDFNMNNGTTTLRNYVSMLGSGGAVNIYVNGTAVTSQTSYGFNNNTVVDIPTTGTTYSGPFNGFTHYAIVRSISGANETWTLYRNGVAKGTSTRATTTLTFTGDGLTLGRTGYTSEAASNTAQAWAGGALSNFRIVKGIAVYTGDFTPSSSKLTIKQVAGTNISAISGNETVFLLNSTDYINRFSDATGRHTGADEANFSGRAQLSPLYPFTTGGI